MAIIREGCSRNKIRKTILEFFVLVVVEFLLHLVYRIEVVEVVRDE